MPAPERLPRPGDPQAAARGIERWLERAREAGPAAAHFAEGLAGDPSGRALLAGVCGNSPFLTHCLVEEIGIAQSFLEQGPDPVLEELLAGLRRQGAAEAEHGRLMALLRRARRRAALVVALADIAGLWRLEDVTAALSRLAETALQLAVGFLLRRAAAAGEIELADPDDPERGSGFVVLALGKLGARELNYSSDIDLIVLYDRERVRYRGASGLEGFFVRLTRELVRLLQDRTEDGYVFRTDLRLRPDPTSTPLALSVRAAETYYESVGQNWERAAMIKARPVAGDIEAGALFLRRLRPFMWRKHLDFAAIQDIHSIKRQIHAVKGHRETAVAGHNIKLGRGGIREIEFYAQTQQLIWGGRHAEVRCPATCDAIAALVGLGKVDPRAAEELIAAYRYLRHVEHRLQMIDDRQIHTLPPAGPDLDRLALFAGHRSTGEFRDTLLGHLNRVADRYAELFEEEQPLSGPGSLVFTGTENDPATIRTLGEMGFADPNSVATVVRGWHHGRYRATRSVRARELLTELMPTLLESLARTPQPDAAFARFDAFLAALPAGVSLFSLLYANPRLLGVIAEIMGGAPLLAEHLGRNPGLLDAVLGQGFFEPLPPRPALARELEGLMAQAADFQDVLDISRRWVKDKEFQVGVRILRNVTDADESGAALSDIAETALAALQPRVEAELALRHGRLPGRGMAILAMGKLGSREMSIGSDLDLIFRAAGPAAGRPPRRAGAPPPEGWTTLMSDGPKPLSAMHYYARLAQRTINAITAPTGEGRLYAVDMRLRPSGNKGPIASSLPGFRDYQEREAWAWEHMALTRARVIHGEPSFAAEIEAVLHAVLTRPRDPQRLAADVVEMRRRIAQQHPADRTWDVKHRRGGLVDLEFITQFLLLRHAAAHPEIVRPNTTEALAALAAAGLLPAEAATALIEAGRLWRRLQAVQRLTVGEHFDEAGLSEGFRRTFAAAAGAADFATLTDMVEASAARVAALLAELVEAPAAGADFPATASEVRS
ncbi:MAG: bifunctional [glutamine synthetase] adenylyltransferase/[glutamine synthetase]-adenylyl-L-tyrosine phosphorylase [Rhodospirillaceae bacterium]|nr:bifunctional [glutamine synthetase] adenylyltransferase/[glutamine synthetase]-adenylyl-L-tyrosine phosphorylase [Rhodospirillaceae bacterium]